MNILITGATGFVGRHLVDRLKKEHTIHILVRPESKYKDLGIEHVFIYENNSDTLSDYLVANHIDGIIHLASLYIAEHDSSQIENLVLSNVTLGTKILEACKKAQTPWFLNTGSIWQNYNAPDYSDQYNPVNLYAATKQAFITVAKYYTETSKLRFCTLKLCDTYGENDTRRKVFALFSEIAESGKQLDMSPGEQLIDIVHIDNVTEAFERLAMRLNNPSEQIRNEYVVTSGRQIRLKDLAKEFEQKHHCHLNINWGGRPYREREVMKPYIGNTL